MTLYLMQGTNTHTGYEPLNVDLIEPPMHNTDKLVLNVKIMVPLLKQHSMRRSNLAKPVV